MIPRLARLLVMTVAIYVTNRPGDYIPDLGASKSIRIIGPGRAPVIRRHVIRTPLRALAVQALGHH